MAQWQVAIQEQVLLRVVLMVSAGPGYCLQGDLKTGSHATSDTFYTYGTNFLLIPCICKGEKPFRDAALTVSLWCVCVCVMSADKTASVFVMSA